METEGPIHISVLHQRLRDAWNIGRIGSRIRENIDAAIRQAHVIRHGDFLTSLAPQPMIVRTPIPGCRREITHIDDQELGKALARITNDAGSISHDDLTAAVARLYGWTRRSADISTRLSGVIQSLQDNGTLAADGRNLTPARR